MARRNSKTGRFVKTKRKAKKRARRRTRKAR